MWFRPYGLVRRAFIRSTLPAGLQARLLTSSAPCSSTPRTVMDGPLAAQIPFGAETTQVACSRLRGSSGGFPTSGAWAFRRSTLGSHSFVAAFAVFRCLGRRVGQGASDTALPMPRAKLFDCNKGWAQRGDLGCNLPPRGGHFALCCCFVCNHPYTTQHNKKTLPLPSSPRPSRRWALHEHMFVCPSLSVVSS